MCVSDAYYKSTHFGTNVYEGKKLFYCGAYLLLTDAPIK